MINFELAFMILSFCVHIGGCLMLCVVCCTCTGILWFGFCRFVDS